MVSPYSYAVPLLVPYSNWKQVSLPLLLRA